MDQLAKSLGAKLGVTFDATEALQQAIEGTPEEATPEEPAERTITPADIGQGDRGTPVIVNANPLRDELMEKLGISR